MFSRENRSYPVDVIRTKDTSKPSMSCDIFAEKRLQNLKMPNVIQKSKSFQVSEGGFIPDASAKHFPVYNHESLVLEIAQENGRCNEADE